MGIGAFSRAQPCDRRGIELVELPDVTNGDRPPFTVEGDFAPHGDPYLRAREHGRRCKEPPGQNAEADGFSKTRAVHFEIAATI